MESIYAKRLISYGENTELGNEVKLEMINALEIVIKKYNSMPILCKDFESIADQAVEELYNLYGFNPK